MKVEIIVCLVCITHVYNIIRVVHVVIDDDLFHFATPTVASTLTFTISKYRHSADGARRCSW